MFIHSNENCLVYMTVYRFQIHPLTKWTAEYVW